MPHTALLCLRHRGQEFVTYHADGGGPRALGAEIVRFARERLQAPDAARAFGRKAASLSRSGRGAAPGCRGAALLAAIDRGEPVPLGRADCLKNHWPSCDYAYVLDLDEGALEFWDLRERLATFPLERLGEAAVTVMADCGPRPGWPA